MPSARDRHAARVEDVRLVTGRGRYIADLMTRECLSAVFLRSPHAHARIAAIDAAEARAMPGVQLILTGPDLMAEGVQPLDCVMHPPPKPGTALVLPARWPLAVDRVRHVGEAVAVVVAETRPQAMDAAERIGVDYLPLLAVADCAAALAAGAPSVHEAAPGNVCVVWENGDPRAVARAFATAPLMVTLELHNARLAACPLEPRGALASWDAGHGRMTLHTPSQGVHEMRTLAARCLRLGELDLRVVTPEVGGSFGVKMYPYPETIAVMAAARRLVRPVGWVATRSESFLSDNQARDVSSTGELALDGDGRFLALRVKSRANMGAYLSGFGPYVPTEVGTRALVGPYATPAIHVAVTAVFTNTVPVDAYRGAGRPEAAYLLERLVDAAARRTGIDPAELRRRNLVPPAAMPYDTPLGFRYDSGDFPAVLEAALAAADLPGSCRRRRESAARGRLRGMGISAFVEPAGGARNQRVDVRVHRDATVTVVTGSQSTGMGHETMFVRLAADRLGIAPGEVRVLQGDSDVVAFGRWTSGSRTAAVAGTALVGALDRVVAKAGRIAAALLQAPPGEVAFRDGLFRAAGSDRTVGFAEVARASFDRTLVPAELELGLDQSFDAGGELPTFPNGCHVCELEVDPDTGAVALLRYVAVDDVGRALDPVIVDGQIVGSLAQGIGQALLESCVYEAGTAQLLSGSFMDYAMPRAGDMPEFATARLEVACRTNPLGVKGAGESGTVGAPAAVINALLDALAPLGVTDIAMPATPARLWQALRNAGRRRPAP